MIFVPKLGPSDAAAAEHLRTSALRDRGQCHFEFPQCVGKRDCPERN